MMDSEAVQTQWSGHREDPLRRRLGTGETRHNDAETVGFSLLQNIPRTSIRMIL